MILKVQECMTTQRWAAFVLEDHRTPQGPQEDSHHCFTRSERCHSDVVALNTTVLLHPCVVWVVLGVALEGDTGSQARLSTPDHVSLTTYVFRYVEEIQDHSSWRKKSRSRFIRERIHETSVLLSQIALEDLTPSFSFFPP